MQKTEHLDKSKTYCELEDDAQIVEYDVCSENLGFYDPRVFEYIGRGVIYFACSQLWGNKQYYFYRRRT